MKKIFFTLNVFMIAFFMQNHAEAQFIRAFNIG